MTVQPFSGTFSVTPRTLPLMASPSFVFNLLALPGLVLPVIIVALEQVDRKALRATCRALRAAVDRLIEGATIDLSVEIE